MLELAKFGAEFTRGAGGSLHLTREGGHSARRIVHAAGERGQRRALDQLGGQADRCWGCPLHANECPSFLGATARLLPIPCCSPLPGTASSAAADATGAEIERALVAAATAHPNIRFFEHHLAVDLLSEYRTGWPARLLHLQ